MPGEDCTALKARQNQARRSAESVHSCRLSNLTRLMAAAAAAAAASQCTCQSSVGSRNRSMHRLCHYESMSDMVSMSGEHEVTCQNPNWLQQPPNPLPVQVYLLVPLQEASGEAPRFERGSKLPSPATGMPEAILPRASNNHRAKCIFGNLVIGGL